MSCHCFRCLKNKENELKMFVDTMTVHAWNIKTDEKANDVRTTEQTEIARPKSDQPDKALFLKFEICAVCLFQENSGLNEFINLGTSI